MVLENATSASDAFSSSDALPASDLDPYESGGGGGGNPDYSSTLSPNFMRVNQTSQDGRPIGSPVWINLNELPRRWSLFGGAPHPTFLVDGVRDQCHFVAQTLQRPIKQDEANALAFHFAKSLRMASYGTPTGLAIAAALAWRGRRDWSFPFWKPFKEGSRFSKNSFGPVKNAGTSRALWALSRVGAYAIVGTTLGQIFFGSYALSVSLAGRAMDPRLKEFTQALQQKQRSGLGKESGGKGVRVEDESAGPRGMETYDMARQRRSAQGLGRERRQQGADDASPTGGAFNEDYMDNAQQPGFMNEQEVRREADSQTSSAERHAKSPFESSSSSQQTSNDASPQASRASREGQGQGQTKASGSAWDRLRQEAMSGGGPTTPNSKSNRSAPPSAASAGSRAPGQQGREDSSSMGEGFGFSSEEEDRQLAKSEAQEDFDARLERERQGRDFDDAGRMGGRRR